MRKTIIITGILFLLVSLVIKEPRIKLQGIFDRSNAI